MRIEQARVSSGVGHFRQLYFSKYNLTECRDINKPIVMFGMYDVSDFQYYMSYKGGVVVVWCGTDSLMLTPLKVEQIKSKTAMHIAKSRFISNDLNRYGIVHKTIPVSWQLPNVNACPRGGKVFHYGSAGRHNFYGESYLPEIEQKTGLKIIKAGITTYTKDQLSEVYKDCFIGLRLTKHDGIPNTVVELGLMGRRCIYNGDLPNAIPWWDVDDVCENIVREFNNRDRDDTKELAEEVRKFIDIGDKWLYYE